MEKDNSKDEKIKKIKSIIEREIGTELQNKQNEVIEISNRIEKTLQHLQVLKYVISVNYYDQNATIISKKGSAQEDENKDEKVQNQIHPTIKKLLPFRSNYTNSILEPKFSRTYGTRNKTRRSDLAEAGPSNDVKTSSSDSSVKRKEESSSANEKSAKLPKYVPPNPKTDGVLDKVNSQRGSSSKIQHRIIIGNISKWISPDTREDSSTHKWMVYIRNQDKDKDITKLIRKVRYFLHESYKPHDIIDVTSPPFHLTRRGWGEFPIRVQLHFYHPLDKPVHVIHNLKLDMTCSGLQVLGAETVFEVSLHQLNNSISENTSVKKNQLENDYVNGTKLELQDVFDSNLLTTPLNLEKSIKKEPDFENQSDSVGVEIPHSNTNTNRKLILDRRKIQTIIDNEHDYFKVEFSGISEVKGVKKNCDTFLKLTSFRNFEKESSYKNGSVLDSISVSDIIHKRSNNSSQIEIVQNKSEADVFVLLKLLSTKLENENQSMYCMRIFRHSYLVNILQRVHTSKLKTVESLLKWFFQRWPIITKLSSDPTYKYVHPYSCPSEEEFFKYNVGKQRSAEWFRAKSIQKILSSLKSTIPITEEIWSTKQILLWSRFHGYSPLSFPRSSSGNETISRPIEPPKKRPKSGESSSEAEDFTSKKLKLTDSQFVNGLNLVEKKNIFRKTRKKPIKAETTETNKKDYRNLNTYTCDAFSGINSFGALETRFLETSDSVPEVDVINVETNCKPSETTSKEKEIPLQITTASANEVLLNRYVYESCKQIGIKLSEEEIISGVMCDSVLRVLSQSAMTFVEELLRKTLARGWLRNDDKVPSSIETEDVLAALIENPQFDIFTNRGLGVMPLDNTKT